MSSNFKKISIGRRRFIKSLSTNIESDWLVGLSELKDHIDTESNFQIVGTKVYFEASNDSLSTCLMLEVIGTQLALRHSAIELLDQESTEVLVHKLEGFDIFNLSIHELIKTAHGLYKALGASLMKSGEFLGSLFHIVYDNEKIELHFFIQKDYIQNQF